MKRQKVLFLCTQNTARSQMAEGFLRHLAGDRFGVYSAGIDPIDEIHPCAVDTMEEVGIDISGQYPKGLKEYMGKQTFNYLIIVCARAEERCPKTFPGVGTTFSWIFEDPRRDEDLPLRLDAGEVQGGAGPDRDEDEGVAGAPRGGATEAPRGARARAPGAPRSRVPSGRGLASHCCRRRHGIRSLSPGVRAARFAVAAIHPTS